jgi:hypothetical protein
MGTLNLRRLARFSCRLALAATALALVTAGVSGARAAVIDLNSSANYVGPTYSQDGFSFTHSSGDGLAYGNWISLGATIFNANGNNPTLFQNLPGTNTMTNNLGQPFSFTSIGLADVYTGARGGDVRFTFNHVDHTTDIVVVSLVGGIFGLQTFLFNQHNLSSVVFEALSTHGLFLQFDLIGASSETPLPAALPLFATVLGAAGIVGWRRKRIAARRSWP